MKIFLTTSRMIFIGSIIVGFVALGACKPPAQKTAQQLQKTEHPEAPQVAQRVVEAPARPSAKVGDDWNAAQIVVSRFELIDADPAAIPHAPQ